MEISSIEINILSRKIAQSISGYFLSGIYSMQDGALMRFNHAIKPEKLVAVSSFATWLTTKNLSMPQASKFVSRIRDQIERSEIVGLGQAGNERICRFQFKTKKGEMKNLYAEFFSKGNLILTDASNDVIVDLANPQTFRHRNLIVGEKYTLPPSRGLALQEVNEEILRKIFKETRDSQVSVIRWFGRNVGTSRKFVEEIFTRAQVDRDNPAGSLKDEDIHKLAGACESLRSDLENSQAGYILLPEESSEIEPDVCPIVPQSWSELSEKKLASIASYPNLSDALDEVQIQALVLRRRREVSATTRAKAEELASAISKQLATIEQNEKTSQELRSLAASLARQAEESIGEDLVQKLRNYEILELPRESPNQLRFVEEPRAFLRSFTPSSLASRLFDEAKRLETANRKLVEVVKDLERQKNSLAEQTRSQELRASRSIVTDRREKQWFERYRWFESSDGRLIIGGRDASSNSIMINKYTHADDAVFHADLQGSPFFILRNSGNRKPPSEDMALEIAEATVSFSRAWKDDLGSADAYWVFGDQVKKSAPSGEYLPRGSFFIEGKKNFIRHVKVTLSVGVTDNLPKEDDSGSQSQEDDQLAVVCGPHRSVSTNSIASLKFAPGKIKSSDFARKVKQQLFRSIKDEKQREAAKKISIDEIIRVLPAGSYKMTSEK